MFYDIPPRGLLGLLNLNHQFYFKNEVCFFVLFEPLSNEQKFYSQSSLDFHYSTVLMETPNPFLFLYSIKKKKKESNLTPLGGDDVVIVPASTITFCK